MLILAGLGMVVGGAAVLSTQDQEVVVTEEITDDRFSSPNVLVYAYWAGDKSEVKSFDLSTGDEILLATLPLNVKHIKLLSANEIIYINDTDDNDYGTQIVAKKIPTGEERILTQAAADVKIDDYRVSPNGQYIATWEVARAVDSEQLFNGISRVYATDVNSGVKNQIYSEVANVPVHYPVAVTNEGRIFLDTYLPNDSAGWAYGMSVSDFSGVSKQDLAAVANGSYGSQPVLSPDGSMLIFTGYDGGKGSGTEIVSDTRRALLSANTVDTLNTSTLSRSRLANLSTENYYANASWDEVSGNALIALISKNADETGTYSYNVPSGVFDKLEINQLDNVSSNPKKILSVLDSGVILTGNVTTSESTLGNLGDKYEQALDGVYVVNRNQDDVVALDIVGGFVQPLTVKPLSYFSASQSFLAAADSAADSGGLKGKDTERLQLQTFTIKPTLAPERIEQQSGDRCRDVAAAACNALLGTSYTGDQARGKEDPGGIPEDRAFMACFKEQWGVAKAAGCADSPLYLYGDKGVSINVKVGTPIFDVKVPYTPSSGFNGEMTGDGGIKINGKEYSSIDFDYEIAARFVVPTRGVVISRSQLNAKLTEYADRLGMNDRETYDFIKYVKSNTVSENIFVSHFSNEISKKLLPLYFSPQPDSYTSIVFYINDSNRITNSTPVLPEFTKIIRDGFSAVEISYIVKR